MTISRPNRRQHMKHWRPRLQIAAMLLLAGAFQSQVAQAAPGPRFIETYVAKGPNGLSLRLQLIKPLDGLPRAGWLNSAEEGVADARFGGSVRKPMRMITKPDFVALEAEKRGAASGARYHIENGVLTICMLSLAPGTYRNVIEMTVPENYTLCAPMELEIK